MQELLKFRDVLPILPRCSLYIKAQMAVAREGVNHRSGAEVYRARAVNKLKLSIMGCCNWGGASAPVGEILNDKRNLKVFF